MRSLILMSAMCALCNTIPSSQMIDNDLDSYWADYKAMYNKKYEVREEYIRRAIWEDNLKYIRRHNLEADFGRHKYRLGMNEYGDLTQEEFAKFHTGFKPSNKTKYMSTFMTSENVTVPEEVDWRTKGYVTEVKNQGRCGSCWAFSATGALEGQHFKKKGKLVSLSEQNIIDCSAKMGERGCFGGYIVYAFEYVKRNGGVDTEASYPYTAKGGVCKFNQSNVGGTATDFTIIPRGDEKALKEAVATIGPIAVTINSNVGGFQLYKEGVFTAEPCGDYWLDHSGLVVGYGTYMGEEYWLFKNSWGKSWGMDGYMMMRRNYNNMCGIATQASYPLV